MNKLERWLSEIKSADKPIDYIYKCGVYNDLFFYMNMSDQQKKELFNSLESKLDFKNRGILLQQPMHYSNDLQDYHMYSLEKNQFVFKFPNQGIIFEEGTLNCKEKEIGYKFSCAMQLGLFGSHQIAASGLIYISEEFILKQKIPTYVLTANCKNPEFKQFSVFIND